MSYITPVTDRSQADILAQNSKAHFNMSDFNRINNNAAWVHDFVEATIGVTIPYTPVSDVTVSTIPTTTMVNLLTKNIEDIRVEANLYIPVPTPIKYNWVQGGQRIKYTDLNLWEQTLDFIYVTIDTVFFRVRFARTGIAVAGADLTKNNSFRSY